MMPVSTPPARTRTSATPVDPPGGYTSTQRAPSPNGASARSSNPSASARFSNPSDSQKAIERS
jgi:hypothetical protein